MRYSVYDYTRRVYDYYEAPGPGGTHAGSPSVVSLPSIGQSWQGAEGVPPARASWKLPMGAKKVGSGERPVGRIASTSSLDLGSLDLGTDPLRLGIIAAIAYLGWSALR